MYRNVVYNSRSREILLGTWNELGERIEKRIPFEPYLYLEHKSGKDGTSIFNTPLKRRDFETNWDRSKFVERAGIKRIFHNLPPEQQFLIDEYSHHENQDSFTDNPLRIFYLDIETFSENGVPSPDEAKDKVNLITLFDSLDGKYHSWGLGAYSTTRDDVLYTNCKTESDLFKAFMRYWTKNYPDILTNWNGDYFDIPYLVNRMKRLFGDTFAEKLSPTGRLWSREGVNRFNLPVTEWTIQSLSCIDYMKAYQKFSRNERESYGLDYICDLELGVGKIEFEGGLSELATNDWSTFVDYNIRDVELMVDLEKKLHFIELCRMIAYKGLTKFEKALQTNNVVAGAFALEARKIGKIIPTFDYTKGGKPPGGLVRYPEPGFVDDIVSFDAASLYPNTMISLNLSPETKIGQTYVDDNFTYVTTSRGKEFKIRNAEFNKWMRDNDICKSVHGTLFNQNEKGIIPCLIEGIYSERKRTKKRGKKVERQLKRLKKGSQEYLNAERQANEFDTLQYTLKILMNSIYGTFGNHYSVLYDLDMSASITLTGQEVNNQSALAVQNYAKSKFGVEDNLIIYGDTDSIYITLTPIFKKLGMNLLEDSNRVVGETPVVTERAMEIIKEIGGEEDPMSGAISVHLSKWALDVMNSKDPRFEFSREKIGKTGIFMNAKKTYIVQVVDSEGETIPSGGKKEFSYTGGAFVSSTSALPIRNMIKVVFDTMILTQDRTICNNAVIEAYDQYCKLDEFTLASRKSIKNLKKYEKNATGFQIGKGTPQNAKASLLYNCLIDHLNLGKKYEKIKSGDKVKVLYVGKNKFGLEYIGFLNKLPVEFGMEPDYSKLYLKNAHNTITRVFNAVGWDIVDPTKNYACDILAEFS